mmetsp:Transcript_5829/g.10399  ORF Transcript_5829/g.10399 Transcript_5829/m.10399 type:complete len:323 (+) Transcript_5829:281-1249(+)
MRLQEQRPLRHICAEHRDTFAYISNLQKEIDRLEQENPEILECHMLEPLSPRLVETSVLDFLVREGFLGVGEVIEERRQLAKLPDEVKEHFKIVHSLVSQVSHGSMDEAKEWLAEHRADIERTGSDIEFTLHKLHFLNLFRSESAEAAMTYIRQHIDTSSQTQLKDLSKLLTVALYPDPETSPYKSEFKHGLKEQLFAKFIYESCKLFGIASKPLLMTVVEAASAALPGLVRFAKVSTEHVWKQPQMELLRENQGLSFHSIFVCPVTREISTPENPAMLLPCGHVVSASSLERLVKSNIRGSVKCPTCPINCAESEALAIHF